MWGKGRRARRRRPTVHVQNLERALELVQHLGLVDPGHLRAAGLVHVGVAGEGAELVLRLFARGGARDDLVQVVVCGRGWL